MLGDWVEHQRLRRRMTVADARRRGPRGRLPSRRRAAPARRYLVARRHDSRFLLNEAEQAEVAAIREAGRRAPAASRVGCARPGRSRHSRTISLPPSQLSVGAVDDGAVQRPAQQAEVDRARDIPAISAI